LGPNYTLTLTNNYLLKVDEIYEVRTSDNTCIGIITDGIDFRNLNPTFILEKMC